MLAVLAMDGPQPREQIAALLWPQASASGPRANLRQRIRKLQGLSGQRLLADREGTLSMGAAVVCDLGGVEHELAHDAHAVRGALLGELAFAEEDAARHWLRLARQRVSERRDAALRAAARARIERGELDAAVPWLQRLADENPCDEPCTRELMLLHHRRGDGGSALAAYGRLEKALEIERGAVPGAETRRLAELLQPAPAERGPGAALASAAVPSRVARPAAGPVPAPHRDRSAIAALLQRPPRLLGRAAEWAALERAVAEGGVAIVLGAAGMGKSRLLGDFARHAGIGLVLRAHDGDRNVAYALLARWVAARAEQAAALPGWAQAELARLHPALGDAAPGAANPLRLCQAFALLSAPEMAVCIDDLHFADDASLELLPKVLEGVRFSLLASRGSALAGPAVPAPLAAWLQAMPERVQVLALAPWGEETLAELLAGEVLPLAEPARWAALLRQHSGGHPLLVLETLRAVLVADAAAGVDALAPPPTLPMAPALLQLLRARVRRLSAAARAVLQVAALAGDAFAPELCAQILAQPLPSLAEPWAELQAEALMSNEGRLHDLVLEAAREDLPAPRAAALHGALAACLAERGAAPARVAPHWAAAGEPIRAARAHEAAATAASDMSRGAEQRHHWAEAARSWQAGDEPERALEAGLNELECLVNTGRAAEAVARGAVLQTWPSTPRQWARLLSLEAHSEALCRHFDRALELAPALLAAARACNDPMSLSEGLTLTALCAALTGRRPQAEAALRECAALELPPGDWQLRLNHDGRRADALMHLGRAREALPLLQACLAGNHRPERRLEQVTQHNNLALLHQRLGEPGPALAHAAQCLALAHQLGADAGQASVSARVLQAVLMGSHLGRYEAAIEQFERVLVQLTPEQAVLAALTRTHLAWTWCQLGQAARAWALVRDVSAQEHPVLRVRAWSLQNDLQRLLETGLVGEPPPGWRDCGDPSTLAHAEIGFARRQPAAQAQAALARLARSLYAEGLEGLATYAQVLELGPLARQDPAALPAAALAARQALAARRPSAAYAPELLLALHDALQAAGEGASARACLDEARAWVTHAADALPAAWREGFRARNRVNARLLAM